ncbi:MAG: hypothetical protein ACE5E5_05265, partial [Phycisphaerae bacterium]
MTAADLFIVAPELLLLLGACVVLIAGVGAGRSMVSPIALVAVLAALGLTLTMQGSDGATVIPGLWITSITFYARVITLIFGALVILVNWIQAESAERGEFMAMILLSLLGVLLTASA